MGSNIEIAVKALWRNKLQACLTLSGMSIGVAMVVIVAGLASGAQLTIESQIERTGPTRITVRPGNFMPAAIYSSGEQDSGGGEVSQGAGSDGLNEVRSGSAIASAQPRPRATGRAALKNRTPAAPVTEAELQQLRDRIGGIRALCGSVAGNVSLDTGADVPVSAIRLAGFEFAWPEIAAWHLVRGRWISQAEHASGAPVAMVTPAAATRLWPSASTAVGQTLRIQGRPIRIVGILSKDASTADDGLLVVPTIDVPLPLAQSLLHRTVLDAITVRTASVAVTTSVARQIRSVMRSLHRLPADTLDDFRVATESVTAMPGMGLDPGLARAVHANVAGFEQASWEETARSLRQAARTFASLLAAAAAVSLIVGGIGIMNIMLVTVAARTREIGLRMSMGAKTSDVLSQFLAEAATLAAFGGLIGLVLGSLGLIAARNGLHWATAVSPTMLGLAVIMAIATGMAFGFGPARRAAALDPVTALRSD